MDARARLARRLEAESVDPTVAEKVAANLDDWQIEALVELTHGDLESGPGLSRRAPVAPNDSIDSLWLFSWGYRITATSGFTPLQLTDPPPPVDAIEPGPVNAAIARVAAEFVAARPVPIVAQWEVALELEELSIEDVLSVEPVQKPDGHVEYLSTPDVVTVGQRMAADAGLDVGQAGVITFAELAFGGCLVAQRGGLVAAIPSGTELPEEYDAESGQLWTRSLEAWLPVDLLGRIFLNTSIPR